jgi:acyl carrier protein
MSAPNREEVLKEIGASISRLSNIPAESIVEGQLLVQDLKLDSLAIYELVVDLEERFGMQISNEDAERLETVKEAVDYVCSRLKDA